MKFKKIINMHIITGQIENKTQEDVLEYEFYALMKKLLDVLSAFENGGRDVLKIPDQYEMLGELKYCYDWLKGNIKCLEEYRNEKVIERN